MNTTQTQKEDRLEKLLDTLELSAENRALARTYLTAEPCDDSLLAKARQQDFQELDNDKQYHAARFLAPLREAGRRESLARYMKLYWSIGKSTAVFVLEGSQGFRIRQEEREARIAALGESATAAMEAESCAWRCPAYRELEWLHELAARTPQVLFQAQTLGGTRWSNMRTLLDGILLCRSEVRRPGLFRRLAGGADGALAGQISQLVERTVRSFPTAAPDLSEGDQKALAGYIQAGKPDGPLPRLSVPTAWGEPLDTVVDTALSGAYLTGLMGVAAFLAQDHDPRLRCALRVYGMLNPMALLHAICCQAPQDYLLDHLDGLFGDVPGGPAAMLLCLARNSCGREMDFRQMLARRCRQGVDAAVEQADIGGYLSLSVLLPELVSREGNRGKEKLCQILTGHVQTGRSRLQEYLDATGSLADSASRLSGITPGGTPFSYLENELLASYCEKAGWDDFACRCVVAQVLLFPHASTYYLTGPAVNGLAPALLQRQLPVAMLLQVFTALQDVCYQEKRKTELRNAVYEALTHAQYVNELCAATGESGVFGRYVALSALDALTAVPGCEARAKAALLESTGDSSKQVRALLLTLLTGHPDWWADYAALLKSKKAEQRLLAVSVAKALQGPLRPALEEALAGEKSAKVADAIRDALGAAAPAPEASTPEGPEQLTAQLLKGGKKRKVQWLLEPPLPPVRLTSGDTAGEDRCAALLLAYCELGRIGRSAPAQELACGLEEKDLAVFANEVYERWLSAGAQSKTKWVLAFAAAFGGPAMTPKLTHAINDWPQHARGAIACDAVTALALSPDPAALLTVDAISRKFKFRQVKAAAGAALEQAATELGITAEELADRIVPDLGFSSDGTRRFDYGPRSFTVRLTPTLELEITNDGGKGVKTLPAPGKSDDPERAAAAYEAFKTMKKQIRTTVAAQKNRLEAALSSLRCWDSQAWQALFVRNPIMHQFAMSLIWGIYQDGRLQTTFRYMEDGSFTTVDEEEYTLPSQATIGLAHPVELDRETLEAWKQQLEDYEITQSIPQLDRPVYRLEPGREAERRLERFGGKMLNGLSLSGKLQSMGWFRGSVQDGGGYYTFYREDPALGLGVELNFSGCFIGDENTTVTVYDAVFYQAGTVKRGSYCYDAPSQEQMFPLGQIPPRYYSEIVYQLERATASSVETDPHWKTKSN